MSATEAPMTTLPSAGDLPEELIAEADRVVARGYNEGLVEAIARAALQGRDG